MSAVTRVRRFPMSALGGRLARSVIGMTTGGEADGEALVGGTANAGAVFRRGALGGTAGTPDAPALHAYLRALREHGSDAAPTPVGLTADGREQLTFIPGEVALPPFPAWVLTTTALESVGNLSRRPHGASEAVGVGADVEWPRDLADTAGGRGGWKRRDRTQARLAAHRETFTAALAD